MLLPNTLLTETSKKIPDLWKKVDSFRATLEELGKTWDKRVFMPLNFLIIFSLKHFDHASPETNLALVNTISSLSAWRPTQDIVRFDPDIYASLIKTPITGNMPAEILKRLPAWGIYIESPGLHLFEQDFEGFFVNLEVCKVPDLLILHFNFLDMDCNTVHLMLPLGDWSIHEALRKSNEETKIILGLMQLPQNSCELPTIEPGLLHALNLLIYICSTGLHSKWKEAGTASGMTIAQPKKIKGVWRYLPPAKPKITTLGGELGEQIRKFRAAPQTNLAADRAHPRPHLRRAHWHGYWEGPIKKNTEKPRQFNVRWLPPIQVGWQDEEEPDLKLHLRQPVEITKY